MQKIKCDYKEYWRFQSFAYRICHVWAFVQMELHLQPFHIARLTLAEENELTSISTDDKLKIKYIKKLYFNQRISKKSLTIDIIFMRIGIFYTHYHCAKGDQVFSLLTTKWQSAYQTFTSGLICRNQVTNKVRSISQLFMYCRTSSVPQRKSLRTAVIRKQSLCSDWGWN